MPVFFKRAFDMARIVKGMYFVVYYRGYKKKKKMRRRRRNKERKKREKKRFKIERRNFMSWK